MVPATELLLRWPAEVPLAALVSGGAASAQNAWTILARPRETLVVGADLTPATARARLAEALARTPRPPAGASSSARPPFDGGWIASLGYGLGAAFEPKAASRPPRAGDPPLAVLHWCEDAWCLEHATGSLHAVGDPPPLLDRPVGAGPSWRLAPLASEESDATYAARVARTIEYVRAGDLFQANVARRFATSLRGSPRAFAAAAIAENAAWFGAAIDLPCGGALVSMSPELFLRIDAEGRAATRPIKGTRPAQVAREELEDSAKDHAELAMIVDLMRNDLGRVAEIGSVDVAERRVLETHRTVHHGVAEIRARLRADVGWLELLEATFPPGSVTGAPKIRAMQVIDELEGSPRGAYCGAIGFIARSGHAALNVAIRTATVSAAAGDGTRSVVYHAGCGIVADSDPAAEVAESHAKARALAQLAR